MRENPPTNTLAEYTRRVADQAHAAARSLARSTTTQKNDWLFRCSDRIRRFPELVIEANRLDLERAPEFGLNAAAMDRLRLTPARLLSMSAELDAVARLPDPVGQIIDRSKQPSGLLVRRVRVPLGVVFFIYESRPNVTVDAAALCVKSGNAVILRGGKEALHTNLALHKILQEELASAGLPPEAVQLVETTDRAAVGLFLGMSDRIAVTIPRGGKSLIERVVAEAKMPVIKHFDGICHVYVDRSADLRMATDIIVNAKCQRPGVCNAAECLLVDAVIAADFLPLAAAALRERGVELRGCERTREIIPDIVPATEQDFRTEYLDLVLSVRVVDHVEEACAHIEAYGSHHTDAIVADDRQAQELFLAVVDSAAVMVNASTRFNDGGELGLGAEIGISTDKLHARGPCGLVELTSYKYIVEGTGHVRS